MRKAFTAFLHLRGPSANCLSGFRPVRMPRREVWWALAQPFSLKHRLELFPRNFAEFFATPLLFDLDQAEFAGRKIEANVLSASCFVGFDLQRRPVDNL